MKKHYTKKTVANTVSIKLMLFAVLLISAIYTSYGQVRVPFTPRASDFTPTKTNYTLKGDFTMIGNTNLQLAGFTYPTNASNNNEMKYVDIDGDINTWNSSSANLTFSTENGANPDCSNIVYAGLYWTGRSNIENTFEVVNPNTIYHNNTIDKTNYTLNISTDSNYTYFLFTPAGTGDTVRFRINSSNNAIQVQRNGGGWSANIPNTYNNNRFNFTTNYEVFSTSNYVLEVSALRTDNTDRAYVNTKKSFDKHKVLLKGPSATTYDNITAADNNIYYPTTGDGYMFSAYAEITDYVKLHGLGDYFVADIALREGESDATGYYGGWGMVVVYENSKMKWRDVTVFDGHAYVANQITANYTFNVSGFNAVQNGDVNLKLGLMAGEGDIAISGDYFQIEKRNTGVYESLSHSSNATNNFFNSSIVTGGNSRNPNYGNNTGMDIAMFEVDNGNNDANPSNDNQYITNNQTSTSFKYGSTQDTYVIFNLTFSVDAYIPEPEVLLTTSAINTSGSNPNVLLPGESATYKIEIRNKGTEATNNTIITIPVPYTSSYQNLSILYNGSTNFTPANAPIYDPNAGATGSIIWNLGTLPATGNPNEILADLSFTLKATTDCSLLVNANCDSNISLGGSIAGTGATSGVSFNQQLIQGYETNGSCVGEPIPTPNILPIDSEAYVNANCGSYTAVRDFYFCNIGSNPIQTSQIKDAFPPGTKYYNEYPLTNTSIQFSASNPFPPTLGSSVYYAIPPGSTTCYYQFTINVSNISSVPTVQNVSYCLNAPASPLTAVPSDAPTSPSAFTLYYYTDNNPSTPAQTSIVPSTSTAGETTYYVAEGYSNSCISPIRVPIKVTVYGGVPVITAPNTIAIEGCDVNNITASTARYPYSSTQSADIKDTFITTGYTASDDETIASITYIDVIDTNTSCPLVVTRTFTITDGCGNTATASQTITITQVDFTAPANGGSTVDCLAAAKVAPATPTVIDACGNALIPVLKTAPADIACSGDMVWVYTYTDCAGNTKDWTYTYTIDVPDFTAPANAGSTVDCLADAKVAPATPNVTDACGNAITPVLKTTPADIACSGDMVWVYTYTDCEGNAHDWSYTYTINVPDFTAPANAGSTVDCLVDAKVAPATPTVIDACGNALIPVLKTTPADIACSGDMVWVYTYTDCEGNAHDWLYTYSIDVPDFTAPANGGSTVDCLAAAKVAPATPNVTDACGNSITPVLKTTPADIACSGDMVWVYTYTDCEGNAHDWSYTYTIDVPDFTLPANGLQTVGNLANAVEPTPPNVTDACGNAIVPAAAIKTATPDCQGTVVYTFTYTDCEGNAHDWTYTYTIELAPFAVPANGGATVNCIADATTPTPPTVSDANGSPIAPTMAQSADPTCSGSKVFTFTYTDCAGNTKDWTYTYTIDVPDFTAPANAGSTVDCLADAKVAPATPNVIDACGNALIPVLKTTPADIACSGDMVWVYTYADCEGNAHDWSYTYTIDVPDFTLPANGLQTVGNLADAVAPTPPNVTDACGNAIVPAAPTRTAAPDCQGTVVYTFNYTDCEGNAHDWTYTYTIDLAPFTVPANGSATVNCIADATTPTPPTVSDANGSPITPTMAQSADPTCSGSKVFTFTYTDCAGNTADWTYTYTIDVPDFTAPANGGSTVDCLADAKVAPATPNVTDACGNAITPVLKTTPADIACSGDMVWVYTYTDCEGNAHDWSYTYTIDVPDFTAPANAGSTVDCLVDAKVAPATPTVIDACGNALIPVIKTTPADIACSGDMVWVYTYTDCEGNAHDWSYTYSIDVPDFALPANGGSTVDCLVDAKVAPATPTVIDACGNALIPVLKTTPTDIACSGDMVWVYTYTDCEGNAHDWSYTYTIDVPDFTAPANGGSTVDCLAAAKVAPATPNVTDACGNAITPVLKTSPADIACSGDMVWVYTYTDCEGNTHDWSYTYTIDVPDFTAPANAGSTVDCLADAKVAPATPTVIDACGNALIPVLKTTPADIACSGDMVWVYTYTDCEGNTHDWSYTYTIDVPDFTLPANGLQTVGNLADAVEPTPPTVSDACGNAIIPAAAIKTATPDCQGTVVYTFNFTDCEGNTHDWTYTYTIELAPFAVPANGSATVNCIADATTPTPPTVSDANGSPIAPTMAQSTDPTCSGSKVFTFTYTDCAGNTKDWTYTYTIDVPDFTAPENAGSTVDCLFDAKVAPTTPTVIDACGNALIPVLKTTPADIACSGDMVWVYTYTDCEGNAHDWSYTYSIDVPDFALPANGGSTVDCLVDAKVAPATPTVIDACGNALIPVLKTTPTDIACSGDMVWVYTYTDCEGNTHDWSYTYTIDVPDFTLPANGLQTVGNLADAVEPTPPTVSDACGNAIIPAAAIKTATPDCQGTVVYTFNFTDCEGNTHDWTYTYTIELAPFAVPANGSATVNCIADATTPTPPTVSDANGSPIAPTMAQSADPTCSGSKVFTFTYTDCASNTKDWTYTYTIDLTTKPVVPVSGNSIVECIADATQPTAPIVTDACGNNIIPVITQSADPICEGTKVYTFTYTDCAGNESVYTYTYTIDVSTVPTVPANGSSTVECIADAIQPTAPIVTDVCNNTIIPVITESADPICEGTKVYTFTYTDCAGNVSVYTYTYTVKDTTAPVLTLPANATAECSADLSTIAFGNATATDNCDPNPTITYEDVTTNGACPGSYIITRTWKATDTCGNFSTADQIISTADTTAPEFVQTNLPSDITVECNAIPVAEILTATDNCGTASVSITEEKINGSCINNYTIKRTWTATDECGLTKSHTQTITVKDTTPPAFVEALPPTNLVVECDAVPTAETLTATDICGSATVSVKDDRTNGSCPNSYTLARIWTATDECGLTAKHTQIIVVRDTKAPTFVGTLPPKTLTAECDAVPTADILTAIDNCGDATVTVKDVKTTGDCPNNYTIVRTWVATDECGLTSKYEQIITVKDTKAPVPASTFNPELNVSCTNIPEVPALTFTDNCSSASAITVTFAETSTYVANVYKDYQIIRTWTVKDECGNEKDYKQTLNVALDEIITDIVAPDLCFDEGAINLNNLTPENLNTDGTWELLEGDPSATINGNIFDAKNVIWDKNTVLQGLDYKFRYTTTDNGCISINDIAMTVNYCKVLPCGENDVVISKAVTPNGDAYNESFDISGIELCGFKAEVKIFNRWGALIYESDNYTVGENLGDWKGNASKSSIGNAGKVPNGTYYYIVTIKDSGLAPFTGPVYLGTK